MLALEVLPDCQLRAEAREFLKGVVAKCRAQAQKGYRDEKAWHFVRGRRPGWPILEELELIAREFAPQRSGLVNELVGIAD